MSKQKLCTPDKVKKFTEEEKKALQEFEQLNQEPIMLNLSATDFQKKDDNDDEDNEIELEMLLADEDKTLGIIYSIYSKGIRKTLEDFCINELLEHDELIPYSTEIGKDIRDKIEQLKENKDELLETHRQVLKKCLEGCTDVRAMLGEIDITNLINLREHIDYILEFEEIRKRNQTDLLNILEEQVSTIENYILTCYNGMDDYLKENNVIEDIHEKLLNVFNKLKAYYKEGLLPIDLDRFFINEMKN